MSTIITQLYKQTVTVYCGRGLWAWPVGVASGRGLWAWPVGVAPGCNGT